MILSLSLSLVVSSSFWNLRFAEVWTKKCSVISISVPYLTLVPWEKEIMWECNLKVGGEKTNCYLMYKGHFLCSVVDVVITLARPNRTIIILIWMILYRAYYHWPEFYLWHKSDLNSAPDNIFIIMEVICLYDSKSDTHDDDRICHVTK